MIELKHGEAGGYFSGASPCLGAAEKSQRPTCQLTGRPCIFYFCDRSTCEFTAAQQRKEKP